MTEKNNPLSYFKNIAHNSSYEKLKRNVMNQQSQKFPSHFLNPDYEKGTFESITADIDPITDKIIEITGQYDFKKDFEKKLLAESLIAKKVIDAMLMQVLVSGGSQKTVGNILLKELNEVLAVADSKYSESLKFKEVIQGLISFVCEKFSISINQPKVIIQSENYNSKFEPKDFMKKAVFEKLYDIAIDEDLIDDTEVTFEMFFNSLTERNPSQTDYIKFRCFNNKMKSFIVSISCFFYNLKARSIEESGVFMTKQGTPITIVNFDKIKEKEDYTKKLSGLLEPYLR